MRPGVEEEGGAVDVLDGALRPGVLAFHHLHHVVHLVNKKKEERRGCVRFFAIGIIDRATPLTIEVCIHLNTTTCILRCMFHSAISATTQR